MSYQTIRSRRGWEEPGETIIQTISKQYIGGAMKKKDRQEWDEFTIEWTRLDETNNTKLLTILGPRQALVDSISAAILDRLFGRALRSCLGESPACRQHLP